MKRKTKVLVIVSLLVSILCTQAVSAAVNNGEVYPITSNEIEGWPQGAETYCETAVLMEAETGVVLFDKGKDQIRYPASITKIMTTLLALEKCSLDEEVTFTETGLERIAEGSNINMQVGEVLTMEQCLHAIMIRSANEVAAQVAEYIGGSQEGFAAMMNDRAQQLGCTNTHFNNPSGLPDENHWTTANDMALIFREALKNEDFVRIIGTLQYTIPPTNLNPLSRSFTSHHALLVPSAPEYYEGCIGGKTGVTDLSLNTLVTGVERDGMTLIAVAMRADPGQVCADSTAMFDYGFSQFEKLEVEGGTLIVPKGTTVEGLDVTTADVDGGFVSSYFYNDYLVGVTSKTKEEIKQEEEAARKEEEAAQAAIEAAEEEAAQAEKEEKENDMKDTYVLLIKVLGGMIIFVLLLVIIKAISNSVKHRKRRKAKRNKR